jgi:hypothetical protein
MFKDKPAEGDILLDNEGDLSLVMSVEDEKPFWAKESEKAGQPFYVMLKVLEGDNAGEQFAVGGDLFKQGFFVMKVEEL